MKNFFLLISILFCASVQAQIMPPFNAGDQPAAPDYSKEQHWLTLPFRLDAADVIPKSETWISDSLKAVDVFYIYPTLYDRGATWCADVNDQDLNKRLNKLPVKFQATTFNHVGRVYTPLYRQGKIQCFEDTTGSGALALDFAYQDVKRAFEYYMKHYNNGRPIIIASHSQGTRHSRQLLKDYFDTKEMKEKLVCAYVIGYGIYPDAYEVLKPCAEATATNCYVTWASFKDKFVPSEDTLLYGRVCVNPISWKMDTVSAEANCGVLITLNTKKPFHTEARIKDNYLWVKTAAPFVQGWNVMHLVDFNLYWHEIRKNAALRVQEYLKARK